MNESYHFPDFSVKEVIPQYLERSKIDGRNKTMKAFRTWVRQRIVLQEVEKPNINLNQIY